MGVERQVPLRMRVEGVEQVVQKVDEPLQVPQDRSQAARTVSKVRGSREVGDSPMQVLWSVKVVVPAGQVARQAPLKRKVPARQAEQVNCVLVDAGLKLSIDPAVHFAGSATSHTRQRQLDWRTKGETHHRTLP